MRKRLCPTSQGLISPLATLDATPILSFLTGFSLAVQEQAALQSSGVLLLRRPWRHGRPQACPRSRPGRLTFDEVSTIGSVKAPHRQPSLDLL